LHLDRTAGFLRFIGAILSCAGGQQAGSDDGCRNRRPEACRASDEQLLAWFHG